MNIYVGNLSYNVRENDLKEAIAEYGQVDSCKLIIDRETRRSKGFAFVEMSTDAEAQASIAGLNSKDFKGRPLTVNEARPRTENRGGSGGGFKSGFKGGSSNGPRRSW